MLFTTALLKMKKKTYGANTNIRLPFRFANKIIIGDDVLIKKNDKLTPEKVTHISSLTMQGKYYIFFVVLN